MINFVHFFNGDENLSHMEMLEKIFVRYINWIVPLWSVGTCSQQNLPSGVLEFCK